MSISGKLLLIIAKSSVIQFRLRWDLDRSFIFNTLLDTVEIMKNDVFWPAMRNVTLTNISRC